MKKWLKYGFIGLIAYWPFLFIMFFLSPHIKPVGSLMKLVFEDYLISMGCATGFLGWGLDCLGIATFSLIIQLLIFFLIGALIGWIIERKVTNSNSVVVK